jgi:PAS domain S-box-containing protein
MRHCGQLVLSALDRRDHLAIVMAAGGAGPRLAEASPSFSRISGFEPARLEQAPIDLLRGPATDPVAWDRLAAAIAGGENREGEIQLATAGGGSFWFGYALTHLRDAGSGQVHAVLTGRDITEDRRRQHEQASMQQLLASVFLKVDAAVVLAQADGAIVSSNAAMQALTGYPAEQLAGMHVRRLTAPEDVAAAAAAHAEQLAGLPRYRMHLRVLHRSGRRIPVMVTSVLVEAGPGQRFRVVTLHPQGEGAAPEASADIGHVQVISLEAIRRAYGDGWETAAGGLMMLAESVLKRRLRPQDVFARCSATEGFVVWFADGEAENAARIAAIAREIRIRLLGEFGEHPGIQVAARAARLPIDPPAGPPEAARLAGLERRLAEQAGPIRSASHRLLQRIAAAPPVELLRVTDRDQRPSGDAWADLPAAIRLPLDQAMAAVPESEAILDLDLLRLRLATEGVTREMAGHRARRWLVPVAIGRLLSRRGRDSYLAALQALAPDLRAHLLLLVAELPPGLPLSRIQETIALLAPLAGGIGLMTQSPDLPEAAMLQLPLALLAIDACHGGLPAEETAFALTARARQRAVPLLVRVAAPPQARVWRELGVGLFAMPEGGTG